MPRTKYQSVLAFFLIIVLCINLLSVRPVLAEGETPTEPPTPTEVVTEPPVASTPAPFESTPVPEDATPEPVEATATPLAEILTQVPESTQVVILDESGNPVPLATQEAADIMEVIDPMWCPVGVLPGGAGCTINFASISALVSNMASSTPTYTQNGIIYFTSNPGPGSLTLTDAAQPTSLGSGAFNTLNDFNLTLQGGWNGSSVAPSFSGQTNFGSNSITIGTSVNPWIGNITLNDFSFSSANQTAVTIYTTAGNITLSNVDVGNQQNNSNTALLNSTSGNITVQNGSLFDGNAGDQSQGFSATTGSGSINVSDTTFSDSRENGNGVTTNNTNDGATLNAPTVTLTNVIATGSDGNGITINNANVVTLNNVTANNNGSDPGSNGFSGNFGSGVFVNGNAGSSVIINGGTFTNNQEYGVEVANPANTTIYVQSTPTCTGNDSNTAGLGCYNDTTISDSTAPVITPTVTGTAGSNGWYRSNVSVSWSVTDAESGILSSTGCTTSNLTSETAGTTLTCSATNNAHLSNSVSVTIKIDKTNPAITFSGRTAPNVNGWNNTDVTVNWSCTDAFSGQVSDLVSQTVTTEGAAQSATGTCMDNAGNSASDTQGGINIDKTAPSLSLPSDITAEATSASGALVSYSASVIDNLDAFVFLNCLPASGSTFGLGSTPVNCSSTDAAGNTANGGFQVTVQDTNGPVIAAHPDETAEATSSAGAAVTYTNPSATDAVDGPVAVNCSPVSGTVFVLGDTTVTCTAIDSKGHAATPTTFTVHVVDTTAPVIASHLDVTVEATSPAGGAASYTSPATSDVVDGAGTATCSPSSGTTFALGDTLVTCTATDLHGNTATPTTFTVHVVDTTAPVIASHLDVTAEATSPAGATVNYSSPSTSDIVDGAGIATCTPASGTTFVVGNTTVTCNAMDSNSNVATPTTFTVHIVDTTAPVLSLPANINTNATGPSGAVATFSASASDIVDGLVLVSCVPTSGSTFPLGATTVNCSATDAHSNTSTGSFIVNVQDPSGPIITLPANITAEATGPAGAPVSFSASALDLVDGPVAVSCAPSSGTSFGFGTSTVNCSASDSSGHTNNAAFLVTVQDTTAPTIAAHSDFTSTTTNSSGLIVNYTSPATSDAVDGTGIASCSPVSGSLFPIGDTLVTCTATDAHGNSASSKFFIHVKLLNTPSSTPVPSQSPSTSSGFIVPLTGGELITLDCNTVFWMFGIKLSFLNLCDHQTTVHSVGANELPAELPDGLSFVMGLDVRVLSEYQSIKDLPNGSGIEMDFPIYNQSLDQFAVLYWNDEDGDGKGEWIEISQQISVEQISQILSTDADDELYQLLKSSTSQDLTDVFFQILTTEKIGTFVLVKK